MRHEDYFIKITKKIKYALSFNITAGVSFIKLTNMF